MRLAAAMVVLLLPAAAWAGSWVLWTETASSRPASAEWRIREAFDTKAECMDAVSRAMREAKLSTESAGAPFRVRSTRSYETTDQGTVRSVDLHCLPAATDPRPR